jgi:hypothetical protein
LVTKQKKTNANGKMNETVDRLLSRQDSTGPSESNQAASKTAEDKSEEKPKSDTPDPNDFRLRNTRIFRYLLSQTTAFIVPTLQGAFRKAGDDFSDHNLGLGKILLPRRADAAQRKNAENVANFIAKGLLDHIKWSRVPTENCMIKFYYMYICAGLIHTAITDGKWNYPDHANW